MAYQKVTTNHDSKVSTESVDQLETDLTKATADLATAETIVASLPEGTAKELQETKRVRIYLKVRTLTERKHNSGVLPLFNKTYLLAAIDFQTQFLTDWKTQMVAHRATLTV